DVIDLNDVRVLQTGEDFRLNLEAGDHVRAGVGAGADHLEGDDPVEAFLTGLVDNAHTAAAGLREDFVIGRIVRLGSRHQAWRRRLPLLRQVRRRGGESGSRHPGYFGRA